MLIVALAAGLLTQFFPCCAFAIRIFSKVSGNLAFGFIFNDQKLPSFKIGRFYKICMNFYDIVDGGCVQVQDFSITKWARWLLGV